VQNPGALKKFTQNTSRLPKIYLGWNFGESRPLYLMNQQIILSGTPKTTILPLDKLNYYSRNQSPILTSTRLSMVVQKGYEFFHRSGLCAGVNERIAKSNGTNHMISPNVRYGIKLCISCSLIIFILTRIEWQVFTATLKGADVFLLSLAFLLLWAERLWAVFKWRCLLTVRGIGISLWALFSIYNIGGLWGLFLPSSLSTDVARGYYLSKSTSDIKISAASVVVDRMMGLFSLLFICLISVLFYSSTFDITVILYILVMTVCCTVTVFCIFWEAGPDFLERRIRFFTENFIGIKLVNMHRSFLSFKKYPVVMFNAFCYSLFLQIIRVVTIYITAIALDVDAELVKFFIVVPITVIAIMIPISIGGFGVREGALISLFGLVGININESFAISGTNSIMVTLIALFGGVLYLFNKNRVQT
jgi:uncharacterized protein (TIRG00374 family)